MNQKKHVKSLFLITLILIPLVWIGIQNYTEKPSVWIVSSDHMDSSVSVAIDTLLSEIRDIDCSISSVTFQQVETIASNIDVLVFVGHGTPIGLEISNEIIPWNELYETIYELDPQKTIIMACHSPSYPELGVFGFRGEIDAEAGAIYSAWHIKQIINPDSQYVVPLNRVLNAQREMLHPLGAVLYFVHGYYGSDDSFDKMFEHLDSDGVDILDNYDSVEYFDYFKYWMDIYPDWTEHDVHTYCTISDFAVRFAMDIMDKEYAPGTQIDIVGHSMGGLIARELLRLCREDLQDYYDVDVGRVITIGTPHQGTNIASQTIPYALLNVLISLWSPNWYSFLLASMAPDSDFITTLNENPSSYSNDIEWTTMSGRDYFLGEILSDFHGGHNDQIVAEWSAHLSFAVPYYVEWIDHNGLLLDPTNGNPDRPFDVVANELGPEIDSDSDGLSDIEEKLVYGTDPDNSDSDGDGLTDGAEVNTYGTNPNYWNTDGDVISDGNEVAWGYNPLNANSPIPASSLISSVSVIASSRTVKVYVNHYTAMDYVKFYVKYKTKFGSWTSYSYKGSDYTPTTNGDYYDTWTHPTVYTRMMVMVKAYDSYGHWLGSDYHTSAINPGGGGGGGDPPPI